MKIAVSKVTALFLSACMLVSLLFTGATVLAEAEVDRWIFPNATDATVKDYSNNYGVRCEYATDVYGGLQVWQDADVTYNVNGDGSLGDQALYAKILINNYDPAEHKYLFFELAENAPFDFDLRVTLPKTGGGIIHSFSLSGSTEDDEHTAGVHCVDLSKTATANYNWDISQAAAGIMELHIWAPANAKGLGKLKFAGFWLSKDATLTKPDDSAVKEGYAYEFKETNVINGSGAACGTTAISMDKRTVTQTHTAGNTAGGWMYLFLDDVDFNETPYAYLKVTGADFGLTQRTAPAENTAATTYQTETLRIRAQVSANNFASCEPLNEVVGQSKFYSTQGEYIRVDLAKVKDALAAAGADAKWRFEITHTNKAGKASATSVSVYLGDWSFKLHYTDEEKAAAAAVVAKIDAIGTVTADSEQAILEAQAAYDALVEWVQPLVTNLDVLAAAKIDLVKAKNQAVADEKGYVYYHALDSLADGEIRLQGPGGLAEDAERGTVAEFVHDQTEPGVFFVMDATFEPREVNTATDAIACWLYIEDVSPDALNTFVFEIASAPVKAGEEMMAINYYMVSYANNGALKEGWNYIVCPLDFTDMPDVKMTVNNIPDFKAITRVRIMTYSNDKDKANTLKVDDLAIIRFDGLVDDCEDIKNPTWYYETFSDTLITLSDDAKEGKHSYRFDDWDVSNGMLIFQNNHSLIHYDSEIGLILEAWMYIEDISKVDSVTLELQSDKIDDLRKSVWTVSADDLMADKDNWYKLRIKLSDTPTESTGMLRMKNAFRYELCVYTTGSGTMDIGLDDVRFVVDEQVIADKAAAAAVQEQIAAIGIVTLEKEEAVRAARAAYDALTDAQKAWITNLSLLETAEELLAELKAEDFEDEDGDQSGSDTNTDTDTEEENDMIQSPATGDAAPVVALVVLVLAAFALVMSKKNRATE